MTEFKRIVSQSGFNIEQRGYYSTNRTPLIYAAAWTRLDMGSILLDMGADVDAYDNDRVTALWVLCYNSPSPQSTALMNRMLDRDMKNFDLADTITTRNGLISSYLPKCCLKKCFFLSEHR